MPLLALRTTFSTRVCFKTLGGLHNNGLHRSEKMNRRAQTAPPLFCQQPSTVQFRGRYGPFRNGVHVERALLNTLTYKPRGNSLDNKGTLQLIRSTSSSLGGSNSISGGPNPEPQEGFAIGPDQTYTLQFDGGSRGNPGLSGAGMVIYNDKRQEVWNGSYLLPNEATNNEAEYTALVKGLQHARRLGIRHIAVQGDSDLIVMQITGRYKVKSQHLKPFHRDAVELRSAFSTFEISHIPREENGRADELANIAMDSASCTNGIPQLSFETEWLEDSPSSNQNTPIPDITSISPEPIINDNVHVLCYSSKTTDGVAGAGAVIYSGINRKDVVWEKRYNLGKCITHNIAHYTALLKGLEAAYSLGISNIIIENNNYLIGKQVMGEFQCKNEKLQPFYQNVVQMKNTVFDGFEVHIVKDVDIRVRHLAETAAEVI